jgi:hypothetical protein
MPSYLPATELKTARTRPAFSAHGTFSKPKSAVDFWSVIAPSEV